MQPNEVVSPGSGDSSQFDFITKGGQQKKPGPSFIGNPVRLAIVAGVVLVIAIVALMIFARGGGGPKQQVLDLMAQATEISRVSKLQDNQLKNESTLNMSSTAQLSLKSQINGYGVYLKKIRVKYTPQQLALLGMHKQTDLQLQTAAQNNNLDSAYLSYLKSQLTTYRASIKSLYTITKSKTLKDTLNNAYNSSGILLLSPQLKNAV